LKGQQQVSNVSENPAVTVVTEGDARQRATNLYRTTDLDVAAIAAEVGVSRPTVYRWLRREGVSFGPNAKKHAAAGVGHDAIRSNEDIAELRGQLAVLIAQVGRLEGLVEALVRLQHHHVA
jgi:transposase-like protein